jgi:Flp pilus assembly protein TadD
MPIAFPRARHGAHFALAVLLSATISFPALAVDTGGGDQPAVATPPPAAHQTTAKLSMMAPKVHLISINDARKLIAKSDWPGAIALLRKIVVQQPKNADALNLLGYSLRQHGEMAEAEGWYLKALKLKPGHLGANEYLGELYVLTGHMDKAKARLAAIAKICGNTNCAEYKDLDKAISAKG